MEPRRSIQDIIPPARNRPIREAAPVSARQPEPPEPPRRERPARSGGGRKGGVLIIGGLIVVAVVGIVLAQTVFRGAHITVTPNQRTVSIDAVLTGASEALPQSLAFQVMSLEESATQKVPATGEETVNERASGTVVVYNASAQTQRFIKNTRFATPEGLIYRVQNSIVVPAAKSGTPGSLEVTVYADEPGEKHNIGLSDFTLPGLKNSAQLYEQVYARSKTPMQGGFTGVRKSVAPAARDAARASLHESLTTKLQEAIAKEVPPGFVLAENSFSVDFASMPDQAEGTDAIIGEKGTAHAIIISIGSLASEIARGAIGTYDGLPVTIEDAKAVSAVLTETAAEAWQKETLSFRVSGTPHIVWVVDHAALIAALTGKPKAELTTVLSSFKAIERAEASIYPVWAGSFPEEAERISVVERIGKEE